MVPSVQLTCSAFYRINYNVTQKPRTNLHQCTDGPPVRNSLGRALARWDNEGGALGPEPDASDRLAVLVKEEEQILQCLGAAVIAQWNDLPTGTQRLIFAHAISMGDPRHSVQLKSLIARFFHQHKDDIPRSTSALKAACSHSNTGQRPSHN